MHDEELRTGNGFDPRVYLGLGERGWLFPDWPVSEGGAGLDPVEKRLLELEKARSQYIDITSSTTHLVWSAVERYLDPALLAEMKPKVASGHVRFCLGYTDPNGGSDIANSTLRAVQDGDEWVLNGSKIFTTGAQQTQYTFLITRTDPDLPKHKGLTMFLVPLDTPGIEVQAIRTFGGERTNVVYYGDVRISDQWRLGPVNAGWSVLHGPLDAEHSLGRANDGLADVAGGGSFVAKLQFALDAAIDWAATSTRADGQQVSRRHGGPGPAGQDRGRVRSGAEHRRLARTGQGGRGNGHRRRRPGRSDRARGADLTARRRSGR